MLRRLLRSHCAPSRTAVAKVEQQMTPLIDVVFQLLAFFVITFKIAAAEGDFGIKMPRAGSQFTGAEPQWALRVQLVANATGGVAQIMLGDRPLGTDFARLRDELRQVFQRQDAAADWIEIELDCDPRLHYEHTIAALDAVNGFIDRGVKHPLARKIRLTPH